MLERNQERKNLPGGGSAEVWRKKYQSLFSARVYDADGRVAVEWLKRFETVADAWAWVEGEKEQTA